MYLRTVLSIGILAGGAVVFAADPAPKVDDGVIRPTLSETEQLKVEIMRLKLENIQLRKQLDEAKTKVTAAEAKATAAAKALKDAQAAGGTAAVTGAGGDDGPIVMDHAEAIAAAEAEGRPEIGMAEAALDKMVSESKAAGSEKALKSESGGKKTVYYNTGQYTFRVVIENGKVADIMDLKERKSTVFGPTPGLTPGK